MFCIDPKEKKKKSISTKTQVPKVFHHVDETHLSSKRDARLTRRIRYRTINYSELAIAKKKKKRLQSTAAKLATLCIYPSAFQYQCARLQNTI